MRCCTAAVAPEPQKINASSSPAFTARLMIARACSRNAVVCNPVPEVSLWVLAYLVSTSWRM